MEIKEELKRNEEKSILSIAILNDVIEVSLLISDDSEFQQSTDL